VKNLSNLNPAILNDLVLPVLSRVQQEEIMTTAKFVLNAIHRLECACDEQLVTARALGERLLECAFIATRAGEASFHASF
jgi:hypothetical protein